MVSPEPYNPDLEVSLKGPIQMTSKYQMVHIHVHLVSLVEAQWPRSLIEWDHYQNAVSKYPQLLLDPAAAIALASENGIKRILPVAFYLLSIADEKKDYCAKSNLRAEARTNSSSGPSQIPFYDIPFVRWELLTHKDFRKLMTGKEKIALKLKNYQNNSYSCSCNNHNCTAVAEFKADLARSLPNYRFDILRFLQPKEDCLAKIKKEMRKEFWGKLPSIFKIEGVNMCK